MQAALAAFGYETFSLEELRSVLPTNPQQPDPAPLQAKDIIEAIIIADDSVTVVVDKVEAVEGARKTAGDILNTAGLEPAAPAVGLALTAVGNLLAIAEGLPFAKPVVVAMRIILDAVKAVRACALCQHTSCATY